MEKVEQEFTESFLVEVVKNGKQLVLSHGFGDELVLDVHGAEQLVKILNNWLGWMDVDVGATQSKVQLQKTVAHLTRRLNEAVSLIVDDLEDNV